MSRILLLGAGPLPGPGVRTMGFPSLRTAQLAGGLVEGGHDVRIGLLVHDDAAEAAPRSWRGPRPLGIEAVDVVRTDRPDALDTLRSIRREFEPHAVVTAGPFLPMALGAALVGDEPLWVDVPGDPMAEAQARAAADGDDGVLTRWHEVYDAALRRGDRFSVIGARQRAALIGALGLAGRLTGRGLGDDLVRVVRGSVEPIVSWEHPAPGGIDGLPDDAFVVLFAGGWNTWLDHVTMAEGVLTAMARVERLHFVSTGGAIEGHHSAAYDAFRTAAAGSPFADRFHFLGWVDADRLPAIHAAADVAICVDRPCYEAELGARTRLLEAMERGVHVASTVICEQTEALRGCRGFTELAVRDGDAIGDALLRLSTGESPDGTDWADLRATWSLTETTRELVAWAARPARAAPGLDLGEAASQEARALRDELQAVHATPTWRLLSRLGRLGKP